MPRRYRGISVIELLVVLVLISAMAVLLLPALAQSRTLTSDTTCMKNLKQHLLAVTTYAADNQQLLPPHESMVDDYRLMRTETMWDAAAGAPTNALYQGGYLPANQARELQCPGFAAYAGTGTASIDLLNPQWNYPRNSYNYVANLPNDATVPAHPLPTTDYSTRYRAPNSLNGHQASSLSSPGQPSDRAVFCDLCQMDGSRVDSSSSHALWINHSKGGAVFPNFSPDGNSINGIYTGLAKICRNSNVANLDGSVKRKSFNAQAIPPATGVDGFDPDLHLSLNYTIQSPSETWYFFW
jgi:type II secretory pathway pseudopilin PulG